MERSPGFGSRDVAEPEVEFPTPLVSADRSQCSHSCFVLVSPCDAWRVVRRVPYDWSVLEEKVELADIPMPKEGEAVGEDGDEEESSEEEDDEEEEEEEEEEENSEEDSEESEPDDESDADDDA